MSKEIIYTDKAPKPIGPYSQAILINGTLYASGQIAIDAATDSMVNGSIEKESNQVLRNLGYVLEAANMSFENVVKASVFLKSMDDFNSMNKVYNSVFENIKPARETVEVSRLPKNVNVEISLIAVSSEND
ncbi:MAG: RidA family protein [Chitinophagales bacterium]|nr:RidA family protein [Chitinophagales bacterium]